MTRKRVVALLTAILSTASLSALSVNAEIVNHKELGFCLRTGGCMALLVETDGTAVTEELLEKYDWIYEYDHRMTEISGEILSEDEITDNTYLLYFQPSMVEEVPMLSRTLQLECDWIDDLQFVSEYGYQNASWTYEFFVTPIDPAMDMSTLEVSELAEFEMLDIKLPIGSYRYYMEYPEGTAFQMAMEKENPQTYYDEYLYMKAYGDAIAEKYSDVIADVFPGYMADDLTIATEIVKESPWQTAGDPNADGTVTAEDAADLLVTAAAAGSGAEIKATAASDVNADGTVSADDAAAVLVYAAAQGSGSPMSWVEILRK